MRDDEGRYWDPDLESSRVRRKGSPPYEWDNDYPFAWVLCPKVPAESGVLPPAEADAYEARPFDPQQADYSQHEPVNVTFGAGELVALFEFVHPLHKPRDSSNFVSALGKLQGALDLVRAESARNRESDD